MSTVNPLTALGIGKNDGPVQARNKFDGRLESKRDEWISTIRQVATSLIGHPGVSDDADRSLVSQLASSAEPSRDQFVNLVRLIKKLDVGPAPPTAPAPRVEDVPEESARPRLRVQDYLPELVSKGVSRDNARAVQEFLKNLPLDRTLPPNVLRTPATILFGVRYFTVVPLTPAQSADMGRLSETKSTDSNACAKLAFFLSTGSSNPSPGDLKNFRNLWVPVYRVMTYEHVGTGNESDHKGWIHKAFGGLVNVVHLLRLVQDATGINPARLRALFEKFDWWWQLQISCAIDIPNSIWDTDCELRKVRAFVLAHTYNHVTKQLAVDPTIPQLIVVALPQEMIAPEDVRKMNTWLAAHDAVCRWEIDPR